MENTTEKPLEERRQEYLKSVVIDPNQMGNKWEIHVAVTNTEGSKAFGGLQLSDYIHPLTGANVPLIDLNGHKLLGLMIDKPTKVYDPVNNPMDRRIVDWLIAHPRVHVQGLKMKNEVLSKKDSNPQITLINLDRQEMTEVDNENRIDAVIGKLSDENPKTGLSTQKLRYLLAFFNLPYFDLRHIQNKTTEKKFLRTKLKNFARIQNADGSLNADKVEAELERIENLKFWYELKEAIRYDIVRESYGSYKYNNVPLGTTLESVVIFLKQNLDVYNEMLGILYPKLKEDGFTK